MYIELTSTLGSIRDKHWNLAKVDERGSTQERHNPILSIRNPDIIGCILHSSKVSSLRIV